MSLRYIPFNAPNVSLLKTLNNIGLLSAFVKAPLVGRAGQTLGCIRILACGVSNHQLSMDGTSRRRS